MSTDRIVLAHSGGLPALQAKALYALRSPLVSAPPSRLAAQRDLRLGQGRSGR